MRRIDEEKYALRYSPRKSGSIWSETNKKRAERMIEQGRMTDAGLAKIKEAKKTGEWHTATLREDTTNIPLDLKKALEANEKARHNFESLTPSYKKQFIWWITSAKMHEIRRRRIQKFVRLAEENKPGMK